MMNVYVDRITEKTAITGVQVDLEHIAQGKPECAAKCPVALALLHNWHILSAEVDGLNIRLTVRVVDTLSAGELYRAYLIFNTPQVVRDFIKEFDRSTEYIPEPFSFDLLDGTFEY